MTIFSLLVNPHVAFQTSPKGDVSLFYQYGNLERLFVQPMTWHRATHLVPKGNDTEAESKFRLVGHVLEAREQPCTCQ